MLVTIALAVPWLVLVAIFSLAPSVPRVPGLTDDAVATVGHIVVYAVLAALIYWLHMRIWGGPDRHPLESATVGVVGAASIGLAFEWAQLVFTDGRTFQVEDVVANIIGASLTSAVLLGLELNGSQLKLVSPILAVTGLALTVFSIVSYVLWDPTLAYAGDHWHTAYRVVICGEAQPLFLPSNGEINTNGAGFIHIDPEEGGDEGKKANLAAFFRSVGGTLTNTSMTMPSGETYSNGDACPDGSVGSLSVSKQRIGTPDLIFQTSSVASYLPRDTDRIIVEFSATPTKDVFGN